MDAKGIVQNEIVVSVYNKLGLMMKMDVTEWNIFRDCQIAFGMTDAKEETVIEAHGRVMKAFFSGRVES